MKILLTGSTGFIGSHLTKRLLKDKHKVYAVIRPNTSTDKINSRIRTFVFNGDIDELTKYLVKEKIEGVIHLASLFLAAHKPENIAELINTNIKFGTEIIEAATAAKVKWFINTGTFWQHFNDKDYSPVNLYAASKQAFETMAQYYTEISKLNFVTIKLSDTFGPNDTRQKIFNIWSRISKSKETIDMSKGEQIIDISHIENVIDAYIQMVKNLSMDKNRKYNNKTFAVTSNRRMSLRKLASLFEKVSGLKLQINWGAREYRFREVMVPWSKGRKVPGWKQRISIEEGIKNTLLN